MSTKKSVPKFIFECQKTGRCCYIRDSIKIFDIDLARWWTDGTFGTVFPYLKLNMTETLVPTEVKIEKTIIQENEKRPDEEHFDSVCPLLNRETKECTIYSTMPITCKAFPLEYNGENFVLKDLECLGIDKGAMTAEHLKQIRTAAKREYTSNNRTVTILPAIHSLLMKELTELAMKEAAAQKEKGSPESE
ncbi:MAG: YkgJ family cysteine cluster protein [Candidatus Lokiarchaeota archaeon]|nr:YkgJ family cysteine cluster protein [Candidatus Lokiarchaeota archaeon]